MDNTVIISYAVVVVVVVVSLIFMKGENTQKLGKNVRRRTYTGF